MTFFHWPQAPSQPRIQSLPFSLLQLWPELWGIVGFCRWAIGGLSSSLLQAQFKRISEMAVTGESLAVSFAITVRERAISKCMRDKNSHCIRSSSQIGITIFIFVFFSELRISKLYRRFTAPKRFDRNQKVKPKRLPLSLFGWVWTIWWTEEKEVIDVAGMDAAVLVRCLSFGYDCFKWISFWCLVVLLPVNLSGNEVESILRNSPPPANLIPPSPPFPPPLPPLPPGYNTATPCGSISITTVNQEVSVFDRCSLTNLEFGTDKLWAHAVTVYIVTLIVLRIMLRYNREMSLLRILYLANTPRGGPSHTCLITDIPVSRLCKPHRSNIAFAHSL